MSGFFAYLVSLLHCNSALPHFWRVCEKLLQFCSLNISFTGQGNLRSMTGIGVRGLRPQVGAA